jgi:hypothetical protein
MSDAAQYAISRSEKLLVRPERLLGAARLVPSGPPSLRSGIRLGLAGQVVELPASWFVVAIVIL